METLRRTECRRVVYGSFREKEEIREFKRLRGLKRLEDIINFEKMRYVDRYMGILESNTRMLVNIDFYDMFTFPKYVNINDEELKVYAPKMFIDHIKIIINQLATKSLCLEPDSIFYGSDFWWDTDNDFFAFFGEEKAKTILSFQRIMREEHRDKIGDWDIYSAYYSIFNQDLSEDAKAFLKPKKSELIKRLTKTLNTKADSEQN